MFKCERCGSCCRNILLSPIYSKLDRGDGVCKYYDDRSLLCTIYDDRPLECNVDCMYDKYFSNEMTREEYYEMNYAGCKVLRELCYIKDPKA